MSMFDSAADAGADIRVEARAKVNLSLLVVGRRPDGYHLLDSIVAFAGYGDAVAVRPAADLSLNVDGPTAGLLPAGEDNIVLRAARLLAERAGIAAGAAILLTKRLPVAAGIGGGSADAAAALTALGRLWSVDLPEDAWTGLALALGADVPVCLRGRATRMAGIGEILTDIPPLPPAWLVLVNPMLPCPTPAVFKGRQGPFSPPMPLESDEDLIDAAALARALARRGNDLAPAAVALVPAIGAVLDALAARPGCLLARMSGSGATCFGLFAAGSEAAAAAAALAAARPDWWVQAAPLEG
jgi:4-diphosphocytidyl-2-C-methyl-D-erythritol kinase